MCRDTGVKGASRGKGGGQGGLREAGGAEEGQEATAGPVEYWSTHNMLSPFIRRLAWRFTEEAKN